jgi:hypothetical protein
MFQDLIAAIRAGVREYRRRRWVRQFTSQSNLPF